jgi:hypothetical protein
MNKYQNEARWAACNTWLDREGGNPLSMGEAALIADNVYNETLRQIVHRLEEELSKYETSKRTSVRDNQWGLGEAIEIIKKEFCEPGNC